MRHKRSVSSVVVGIDGSAAAINAAEWAVDEAMSRDSPLRLIYILEQDSEAIRLETEYAQTALLTACAAVEATGQQVKTETMIVRGRTNAVLAEESRAAAMVVVGAFGNGYPTRKPVGSTAAALARSARCPLAVVRAPTVPRPESGVIAVVVEGSQPCDALLRIAMDEARLRKLPLLALCVRPHVADDVGASQLRQSIARWRHCFPDVEVDTVAIGISPAGFLSEINQKVLLVIVDGNERTHIPWLPVAGPSFLRTDCSVLVVLPTPR